MPDLPKDPVPIRHFNAAAASVALTDVVWKRSSGVESEEISRRTSLIFLENLVLHGAMGRLMRDMYSGGLLFTRVSRGGSSSRNTFSSDRSVSISVRWTSSTSLRSSCRARRQFDSTSARAASATAGGSPA